MRKVYVKVHAFFDENGDIFPQKIIYENGNAYTVNQILEVRRAASLKAGGAGIRYHIRIGPTNTYIFLEETRWFVEAKDKPIDHAL